jgi:hypothetical protein
MVAVPRQAVRVITHDRWLPVPLRWLRATPRSRAFVIA